MTHIYFHCDTFGFRMLLEYFCLIQGPAEILNDLVTQLCVEPLAWRICPECPSETQSISVAMEHWSLQHGTTGLENLSLSALVKLKAFQLPWSTGL